MPTGTRTMLMYIGIYPGGRPTIVFSDDVSPTRQHSIRDTPLRRKETPTSPSVILVRNGPRITCLSVDIILSVVYKYTRTYTRFMLTGNNRNIKP